MMMKRSHIGAVLALIVLVSGGCASERTTELSQPDVGSEVEVSGSSPESEEYAVEEEAEPDTAAIAGRLVGKITPPVEKFLMAFHSCMVGSPDCNNPAQHEVQLAQSANGITWTVVEGWQAYPGSVPDVLRRDDVLYVISTSGLRRIDMVSGDVYEDRVELVGSDLFGFVDPSLALLPTGELTLFFLPGQPGGDPASCGTQPSCTREIRSALEIPQSQGGQFAVNPVAHVSVTIDQSCRGGDCFFSDPDIFFNGKSWVLYISRGASTDALISKDINGPFDYASKVSDNSGGVPAGIWDPERNTVLTYVSNGQKGTILNAASVDGLSMLSSFSEVLNGAMLPFESGLVGSPGLAINE
ncbi:MAG: hypothetical protein ABR66_02085 [Microbacteriaceae bacterium BACL25 MAG-120322-bin65]|jgi:hypothetical protein|nr:MAG: hypothetical protein ABR66_02085 [Microbacteriaceae bacterium BACL25 MAG-120322-bin65]HAA79327.1 hypothetical protein [Microbacteriaceae bacterium]